MARKRIEIPLPIAAFTTETLKDQNPRLSDSVINGRLREWLNAGHVGLVGKKNHEVAQRKAWYLYEPVHPKSLASRKAETKI